MADGEQLQSRTREAELRGEDPEIRNKSGQKTHQRREEHEVEGARGKGTGARSVAAAASGSTSGTKGGSRTLDRETLVYLFSTDC